MSFQILINVKRAFAHTYFIISPKRFQVKIFFFDFYPFFATFALKSLTSLPKSHNNHKSAGFPALLCIIVLFK